MIAIVLSTLLVAQAGADVSRRAEARRYFDAGERAFAQTKYGAAIAAFEQAQAALPNPAVVFSLAQAHRLRYFADLDGADLVRAEELYRRYLAEAPTGGRRKHAVEHLATITPMIERLRLSSTSTRSASSKRPTRLMVQVDVGAAQVALDDHPATSAPLIEEVAPGRHAIRVTADGYFPAELTRTAAEGTIAVVDVELRPRPGVVTVAAPDGADVFVDGTPQGEAPLGRPLELAEGPHRVEVVEAGRRPFARRLDVTRGGTLHVDANLEATTQRHVALWMLGGAGALAVAGGVVALIGVDAGADADETATKLFDEEMALTADEIRAYKSDKRRQGRARVVAASMLSVAAAGAVTGLVLYLLDEPTPGIAPAVAFEEGGGRLGVTLSWP